MSPVSISTALVMTYAGARGETEKQMARVLHFSLSQKQLHPAFSELLSGLKGAKAYELAIANRLWGQKDYFFLPDFLKVAETHYDGGFELLDFEHNPQPSRKIINEWVEEKTKRKIKDLLQQEDITNLTRLVLTNAIYFKGSWIARFDPKMTKDSPFFLADGKTATVPLMSQNTRFNYLERQMFQLLELPYAGDRLSMLILLPKKGVELSKVESLLTLENLHKWRASLQEEEVLIFLPRFRMATRFVLNDTLQQMGMDDAFNVKADFSGMTGHQRLFISRVVHKAFVDVNEEGTEAAAATAVVMSEKSAHRHVLFRADHPFVFLILDKQSGSVLFLGKVMNPREG